MSDSDPNIIDALADLESRLARINDALKELEERLSRVFNLLT